MNLQFLGAAGTVTGSKFHLSDADHSVLVDAGMFQGPRAYPLPRTRSGPRAPWPPYSPPIRSPPPSGVGGWVYLGGGLHTNKKGKNMR